MSDYSDLELQEQLMNQLEEMQTEIEQYRQTIADLQEEVSQKDSQALRCSASPLPRLRSIGFLCLGTHSVHFRKGIFQSRQPLTCLYNRASVLFPCLPTFRPHDMKPKPQQICHRFG